MTRSHLLLIGGRSEVGKSTVAFALHDLLADQGVDHAAVEGDALDLAHPAPWKLRMAEREHGASLAGHLDRSRRMSMLLESKAPATVKRIGTDDKTPFDVAEEIRGLLEW